MSVEIEKQLSRKEIYDGHIIHVCVDQIDLAGKKKIQDYPVEHISRVEWWANTLPRKIPGYKTPEGGFREEMLAALTA